MTRNHLAAASRTGSIPYMPTVTNDPLMKLASPTASEPAKKPKKAKKAPKAKAKGKKKK
jgi:hypothetical protein